MIPVFMEKVLSPFGNTEKLTGPMKILELGPDKLRSYV
jgi:putative transposon-encoded protein